MKGSSGGDVWGDDEFRPDPEVWIGLYSAEARQLSSWSAIPFSAGLPPSSPRRSFRTAPKLQRQSGEGDMEEKGIVHPELSCRIAAELPPPDCPRSFGSSSAPGIHRRSCRTAARRLRRQQSKLRRQSGNSGAGSSAAVRQHSSRMSASFSLWAMDKMLRSQQQLCRLLPAVPSRPLLLSPSTSSLPTPSLSLSPMLVAVLQLSPRPLSSARPPAPFSPLLPSPSSNSLPTPFSSPRPPAPSRPLLLSPSPRLTAGLLAWVEEGNRADSLPWKLQGRVL
ncbi:unnamed protein product [Boreogadus saida]